MTILYKLLQQTSLCKITFLHFIFHRVDSQLFLIFLKDGELSERFAPVFVPISHCNVVCLNACEQSNMCTILLQEKSI